MDTKQVKVAIVGGGWFGNFHLENLLTMKNVQIVALCSKSENSLKLLSKKSPSSNSYLNYMKLLENELDLDAIIVCVPPNQHNNLEIEASKRKIHLYLEKPLGVSLEEVRLYEQAIIKSNILCSIGYQTLYNPCIDEIKEFLVDKKIGNVIVKWMGIMPQTAWWRKKQESGGQLHEQVTHIINILIYLFGDVSSAFSKCKKDIMTHIVDYDVEDVSTTILEFSNGILANVSCGCFIDENEGKSEISFEIYTDKGLVKYVWDTEMSFEYVNCSKKTYFSNDFHPIALRNFIDAVVCNDRSKIKCNYSEAMKTFLATYAANISMEQKKEIFTKDL